MEKSNTWPSQMEICVFNGAEIVYIISKSDDLKAYYQASDGIVILIAFDGQSYTVEKELTEQEVIELTNDLGYCVP